MHRDINGHMDGFVWMQVSYLVVPEQQRVQGVRQVEGQRRWRRDDAGIYHVTGGRGNCLAELPQKDFGAGQHHSSQPHQQQLQQHRQAAFNPPTIWLRRGGGGVETSNAKTTEGKGGDTKRYNLWRQNLSVTLQTRTNINLFFKWPVNSVDNLSTCKQSMKLRHNWQTFPCFMFTYMFLQVFFL